jgi:hypothetical protein
MILLVRESKTRYSSWCWQRNANNDEICLSGSSIDCTRGRLDADKHRFEELEIVE